MTPTTGSAMIRIAEVRLEMPWLDGLPLSLNITIHLILARLLILEELCQDAHQFLIRAERLMKIGGDNLTMTDLHGI